MLDQQLKDSSMSNLRRIGTIFLECLLITLEVRIRESKTWRHHQKIGIAQKLASIRIERDEKRRQRE
jgi:hypothetical protein